MQLRNVLLIGGSGLIGSAIARKLSAAGLRVTIPTRRRERVKHLIMLPTVDVVQAKVTDAAVLAALVRGQDAVINLAGILQGGRGTPYGPAFRQVHVDLPANIAAACVAAGVKRLLHFSALGAAADAPSMYLRSKAAGEAAVLAVKEQVAVTVFRPSIVFGPQDRFLNFFALLQRRFPFIALGRAQAKMQPVYVEDVAQAVLNALDHPATFGATYEIAGPRVYTLKELMQYAGAVSGHPRLVIELPDSLAYLQAGLMEWLPNPPLSRDNLDTMRVDNVMAGAVAPELGVHPVAMEAVVPGYLSGASPRERYMKLRDHAGR